MKFGVVNIFYINSIFSTNPLKRSNSTSQNDVQPANKRSNGVPLTSTFQSPNDKQKITGPYTPSSTYNIHYLVRCLMHYICYTNDRPLIKNNVLNLTKSLINSIKNSDKNSETLLKYLNNIVQIIDKDPDFNNNCGETLSFFISMFYNHKCNISNVEDQIIELKSKITSFIKSNNNVSCLSINRDLVPVDDASNILINMSSSRKAILFKECTGEYISDLLDMCNKVSIKLIQFLSLNQDINEYESIFISLRSFKSLNVIIKDCKLISRTPNSIFKFLDEITTIENLLIEDMKITEEDIECIKKGFDQDITSLSGLILTNIDEHLLLTKLKNQKNFLRLELRGYNLDSRVINSLSEFLHENNTLQELDITSNNISSENIKNILEELKNNNGLKTIRFKNNNLKIGDYIKIAEAILNNQHQKIKHVVFNKNNFESFGLITPDEEAVLIGLILRIKDEKNCEVKFNWFNRVFEIHLNN